MTNGPERILTRLLLCSFLAVPQLLDGIAPSPGRATADVDPQASPERDGQHDFDFEFGSWKARLSRLQHPLTGSTTWLDYEGTSVVRKVWDGRANLGELDVDGPSGHIQGLTLRLYNPQSRQWNISWANAADPTLGQPMTGEFKDGRGEFYGQEPFNGRIVTVRFVFSDITPTSFKFEQAFSKDWGKTWEVNWKAVFTR
jgi:hypothetical protein